MLNFSVKSNFLNLTTYYDENDIAPNKLLLNGMSIFERDWIQYLGSDFTSRIEEIIQYIKQKGKYTLLIDSLVLPDEIVIELQNDPIH